MKIVLTALLAVLATGCARVTYPDGTVRTYVMTQVGVFVRVVNNTCAPKLELETIDGVVHPGLPLGSSATIPLESRPFSGSSRRMILIAKGYRELPSGKREYLGVITRQFSVNTYNGTDNDVWIVDDLRLPGSGWGGCR